MVKNLPANVGDIRHMRSIPGSRRSPGRQHDTLLQYSCVENPMDRGAWGATVHGVAKESDRTEVYGYIKSAHYLTSVQLKNVLIEDNKKYT